MKILKATKKCSRKIKKKTKTKTSRRAKKESCLQDKGKGLNVVYL